MNLKVTVKRVIQVLALFCMIMFFCPSFLVSCAGQTMSINAPTAAAGVKVMGQAVSTPAPYLWLLFLIPAGIFGIFFVKKLSDKVVNLTVCIAAAADFLFWIIFLVVVQSNIAQKNREMTSGFNELASEMGGSMGGMQAIQCTITAWYVFNLIFLAGIFALSVMVMMQKLTLNKVLYSTVAPGTETPENAVEGEEGAAPVEGGEAQTSDFLVKAKETALKLWDKVKVLPKKVLIAIGAGIVALIVLLCVLIGAKTTINLNKFVKVNATGYDGYGDVEIDIDWDAIQAKYGTKLSFTKEMQKQYGAFLYETSPMECLSESVSLEYEIPDKVSNGTVIKYSFKVDPKLESYLDCKIKFKDGSYKVSGLKDIPKFDAFADIEVEFSGISPYGRAELIGDDNDFNMWFSVEPSYDLKNGDEVTVTAEHSYSSDAEYAAEYGKLPKKMSKKFKVSGLDEYVTSAKDFTEDFWEDVKEEAEDTILAYTADRYSSYGKLSGLEYFGYVFVYEENDSYDPNELFVVYSGSVKSKEKSTKTTVYYPVQFSNILQSDGEMSYGEHGDIQGYNYIPDVVYSNGYINVGQCFVSLEENCSDEGTLECGDGFEIYSKRTVAKEKKDLSKDCQKDLSADAKKIIQKYIKDEYATTSKVSNLKEVGTCFFGAKKDEGADKDNMYLVVYSATLSSTNNSFETTTVYYPVCYYDLVELSDGSYINGGNSGVMGDASLTNSFFGPRTKGYTDAAKLYSENVTVKRQEYKVEVSDGLKKLGE